MIASHFNFLLIMLIKQPEKRFNIKSCIFSVLLIFSGEIFAIEEPGKDQELEIIVVENKFGWDGDMLDGPILENGLPRGIPLDESGQEKYNAGWTVAFDNDVLAFGNRDLDYTGGAAVTFAGRRAKELPFSLDSTLDLMNGLVPNRDQNKDSPGYPLHSMQVGLLAFTPDDLNNPAPIYDDRPYASLLFLANSRTYVSHPSEPVYETSFTLGILGLDLAKGIQRELHQQLSLEQIPEGWDYQISEGGEPTARFVWARQSLLASNFQTSDTEYELKWRVETSVGYLTEASIALSGRWGLINSPWWSFTPERADYVSQPAPVIGNALRQGVRELYVWGGVKLRARAYNVFLQGQFRDSEVELSSNQIEHLNAEAWVGLTWQISNEYRLGYVIRYQTQELKSELESRDLVWGGLILSRDL